MNNTSTKQIRRTRGSLTKQEILSVSMDILLEEGVEALSMRRIAHRLGCSVASPYTHFENQEEIIHRHIQELEGARQVIG